MSSRANRPLYYAGMLSGNIANQIQSVAVAWHVYSLHHKPFDLGLVGLALFLPTFAFALPAGVVADRYDRRAVVAVTRIVNAFAIGAFALTAALGTTTLWAYLAILFVMGTAVAFGNPATRSLLPAIVEPENYVRAQATYSSLRELTIVGGPALGGVLVAISTPLALAVSAVGYVASSALIVLLRITRDVSKRPPTLRDALEGLRFIVDQKVVLAAISLDLFAVLFGGATALLPAFADGIFSVGPQGLGAMRSAPAIGAAVVAALIARRPLERRVGPILLFTVAGFGLATIAFGLSKNFIFSLAMLVLVGATDMVSVVIRNGLVQLSTPDAMRGRVTAVENVFIGASNEFGEFESGTLAALIGIENSVVFGGVGTIAVIALWAVLFPALRRADRFVETPNPAAAIPETVP